MAVYVDNMRAKLGNMVMCHMVADTDDELHARSVRIGVSRRWHQAPPKHDSHYDIALTKRRTAVEAGAIEVTWKVLGMMTLRRRVTGSLGKPEEASAWCKAHFSALRTAAGGAA